MGRHRVTPEPSEPTGDQCTEHAKVFETETKVGYAIWYPQMGGYVGKAVAVMDKTWRCNERSASGGCIDVYVWHDGDFPFCENDGDPCCIHHCDPEQFVDFGKTLTKLNKLGRTTTEDAEGHGGKET